jgi:hypothetical protein
MVRMASIAWSRARRHFQMHVERLRAGDDDRRIAECAEHLNKRIVRNATKDCRIGDFITVEMQDRQHGSVAHRIKKLVAVPGRGERTGFCFSIADHACHNEGGIIECSAIGVG